MKHEFGNKEVKAEPRQEFDFSKGVRGKPTDVAKHMQEKSAKELQAEVNKLTRALADEKRYSSETLKALEYAWRKWRYFEVACNAAQLNISHNVLE
jgi:uncharacterized protein YlxW (UPF0749 family)